MINIFVLLLTFTNSISQSTNTINLNKKPSPNTLYKYYVYTEYFSLIGLGSLNLSIEVNLREKKMAADYLKIDFSRDKYLLGNYFKLSDKYDRYLLPHYQRYNELPSLPMKSNYSLNLYYVIISNKRQLNYEASVGFSGSYGESNRYLMYIHGNTNSKFVYSANFTLAIRYAIKNSPLQIRLANITMYNLRWKQFLPIYPNFSIGYGFKKLKDVQTKKRSPINSAY